MANKGLRIGNLENKPDWYSTPLDKLDFEWTKEEKLEIERYCERILKNVAGEDMTPKERLIATHEGKPHDRSLLDMWLMNLYTFRTLDSLADAIKPIDEYHYPKFIVKGHLAAVARYHLDFPWLHPTSYTEEFWGGNAKLPEYGNPIFVGEPPIKSMADLEGLEVPDPYKHGMYPGYLWACREMRRIFDQYGLTKVMVLCIAFSGSPLGTAMLFMTGMANFMRFMRKDPELCKACVDLCTEYSIRFGEAVWDVSKPELEELCCMTGVLRPIPENFWVADRWAKIGRTIAKHSYCTYGMAYEMTKDWFQPMLDRGALAPHGSFCGGTADIQIPYQKAIDFGRAHDLFFCTPNSDHTTLDGPASAIEDELQLRWDYAKGYTRFALGIPVVDYWTPPAHIDALVNGIKKISKMS